MRRLVLICLASLALIMPVAANAMNIQRVVSPGGIEAWLVEEHSVPVLVLDVNWRGSGAAQDPAGKTGTAYMMAGLMNEGAGDLDSPAFQAALADKAISLYFDADKDDLSASLTTLGENRGRAFELLRLALSKPRFDSEAIERGRAQVLSALASESDDPDSMAARAWYAAAFPGHPYALPVKGTPETVTQISRADLVAFSQRVLARGNMKIAVVGPITAKELGPLLDRTFGTLPSEPKLVPVADVTVAAPPSAPIVVPQDNAQSAVLFGETGINRSDPDFMPAYVMNYVLGGGGFSSRLMNEVREKRGLAYGIDSGFYAYEHAPVWLGQYGTRNAQAGQSLALTRREMARMAQKGITADELANAKTYLTGSYPLHFDSNAGIASQLLSIQVQDLGIDYVNRRNALVEAVTLDDVARVSKRLLHPDALLVTAVGRPNFKDQSIPPAKPGQTKPVPAEPSEERP
ncbi:MAG: pitrilysin family protein [Parvibaculaceae bacterium]|nr:pitrilysin family protein [Parvibaculaceae bacterium]